MVMSKSPYNMKSLILACEKEGVKVIKIGKGVKFQIDDSVPIFSGSLDMFKEKSLFSILTKNKEERQSSIFEVKKELDSYYSKNDSKNGMEEYLRSKKINELYEEGGDVKFTYGVHEVKGYEVGYKLSKIQWHDAKAQQANKGLSSGRGLIENLLSGVGGVGAKTSNDDDDDENEKRRKVIRR